MVVLRLRGQPNVGATLSDVLSRYADQLKKRNGRIYVTGLNEETFDQLVKDGKFQLNGPIRAYELTPVIGESTSEAISDAQAWLIEQEEHKEAQEVQSGNGGAP